MPDYHSIRDPCLRSLAQIMKFEITDRRVPHFQRIVVAEVQHHSDIDAITADIMNNMGACFEVQQNLDQAHQFYSESLKLRKVSI